MNYSLSQRLSHFFHKVSEIRPIIWIGLYICAAPLFALIYWALPDGQFRIPEGASTNYGSWLYYSIVSITTLGFGDYTPAGVGAQAVTAVEVMCGLIFLGLFLNAVGAMKSEIDVESELEKQKRVHFSLQLERLLKSIPIVLHNINAFLAYCYAVTTPPEKRTEADARYNPDFTFNDMHGLFKPTGLIFDRTNLPGVERLLQSSSQISLLLDSLQQKIDLTLWPELLEDCFSFVANCQMFADTDVMFRNPAHIILQDNTDDLLTAENRLAEKIRNFSPGEDASADPDLKALVELEVFIKENAMIAMNIETRLTLIANSANSSQETPQPVPVVA